jgi:hypothetical protein
MTVMQRDWARAGPRPLQLSEVIAIGNTPSGTFQDEGVVMKSQVEGRDLGVPMFRGMACAPKAT